MITSPIHLVRLRPLFSVLLAPTGVGWHRTSCYKVVGHAVCTTLSWGSTLTCMSPCYSCQSIPQLPVVVIQTFDTPFKSHPLTGGLNSFTENRKGTSQAPLHFPAAHNNPSALCLPYSPSHLLHSHPSTCAPGPSCPPPADTYTTSDLSSHLHLQHFPHHSQQHLKHSNLSSLTKGSSFNFIHLHLEGPSQPHPGFSPKFLLSDFVVMCAPPFCCLYWSETLGFQPRTPSVTNSSHLPPFSPLSPFQRKLHP